MELNKYQGFQIYSFFTDGYPQTKEEQGKKAGDCALDPDHRAGTGKALFWSHPAPGNYLLYRKKCQSPSSEGNPSLATQLSKLIKFRTKPAARRQRPSQLGLWKFLAKKINRVPGSWERRSQGWKATNCQKDKDATPEWAFPAKKPRSRNIICQDTGGAPTAPLHPGPLERIKWRKKWSGRSKDKWNRDEKWVNEGPGLENISGGGAEISY